MHINICGLEMSVFMQQWYRNSRYMNWCDILWHMLFQCTNKNLGIFGIWLHFLFCSNPWDSVTSFGLNPNVFEEVSLIIQEASSTVSKGETDNYSILKQGGLYLQQLARSPLWSENCAAILNREFRIKNHWKPEDFVLSKCLM